MTAIALIGNTGVGKDTIAKYICSADKRYSVIKFAQPIKNLVAAAVDVPVAYTEDKMNRVLPIVFWNDKPYSILDLLRESYEEQQGTILHEMMVRNVVWNAKRNHSCIFTDIRNLDEAYAVKEAFPYLRAFHIYRKGYEVDVCNQETLACISRNLNATPILNNDISDIGILAHQIMG